MVFLIESFILQFDIPKFEDKRLNKKGDRKTIKRKKDVVSDDIYHANRYAPHIQNIASRVEAASKSHLEKLQDINMHLDHMVYQNSTNELLTSHIQLLQFKEGDFVDL